MRYVLLSLLVCGCGLDRDIEGKVTIQQGVYGQLVAKCGTSGCEDQPASGQHVTMYAASANGSYANATADGDGFYEIEVPAGDYTMCTSSCTQITVPAGIVRYDWVSGPGGGQWARD